MSGLEAIAVIGVVAALITAFKDSNSIANAIKQRRKARPNALPPTVELEEALSQGEQDIQKAAAEGIRRWGQNWVDDELDAKVALQAIVIEVQASMLRDLSIAVQDDSITDVSPQISINSPGIRQTPSHSLKVTAFRVPKRRDPQYKLTGRRQFTDIIESSTEARMRAVNILTSLYLRKKRQTSSRAEEQIYQAPEASARAVEQTQSPRLQRSQPIPVPDRSRVVPEPLRQKANEQRRPRNDIPSSYEPAPEQKQEQPRSSWKRKLSGWTQSYVDERMIIPTPIQVEQPTLPAQPYLPSMSSSLGRVPPPYCLSPIKTHADPLNPWADTRSTTDSDSRHSIHSFQSQTLDRRDTRLSSQVMAISPDNNHGGFCPSAYQLQVGLVDSAIKIHNASTSMTGQGQYYACRYKRCVFEGPAVLYEKIWSYDRNLRSRNHLEYRWLFLAKSHIPQERVKNKLYDFRCLICVLLADRSSTFHGSNQLLEHVGGHAGTQLAGITLLGPLVVTNNSITQAHDDNFDIRFIPDRTSSLLEHSSSSPTSTHISSDVVSVNEFDTLSTFNPKWK